MKKETRAIFHSVLLLISILLLVSLGYFFDTPRIAGSDEKINKDREISTTIFEEKVSNTKNFPETYFLSESETPEHYKPSHTHQMTAQSLGIPEIVFDEAYVQEFESDKDEFALLVIRFNSTFSLNTYDNEILNQLDLSIPGGLVIGYRENKTLIIAMEDSRIYEDEVIVALTDYQFRLNLERID